MPLRERKKIETSSLSPPMPTSTPWKSFRAVGQPARRDLHCAADGPGVENESSTAIAVKSVFLPVESN